MYMYKGGTVVLERWRGERKRERERGGGGER